MKINEITKFLESLAPLYFKKIMIILVSLLVINLERKQCISMSGLHRRCG